MSVEYLQWISGLTRRLEEANSALQAASTEQTRQKPRFSFGKKPQGTRDAVMAGIVAMLEEESERFERIFLPAEVVNAGTPDLALATVPP